MAFDTAVSGLRAASSSLGIIGNNVANASTTGFKSSRADFADLFAAGSGGNAVGKGVVLSNVNQSFEQGNVSFTGNSLDVAINGDGFFTLNDEGAQVYRSAGAFPIDSEG